MKSVLTDKRKERSERMKKYWENRKNKTVLSLKLLTKIDLNGSLRPNMIQAQKKVNK